jgi:hypothetical protein
MKSFLATTAIVLVMGGAAYAAPVQFNTYQTEMTDIQASSFIGQRVYAVEKDIGDNQTAAAGPEKDWEDIGEINDVVLGRDGNIKAVVLGVGGFLGIGEKNVAVSMNDVKFVRNGENASDYFLVVNTTKDALTKAPSYNTVPETAANTTADPNVTTPAEEQTTAATPDLTKPADTASDQAANTTATNPNVTKPADTAKDQASTTTMTPDDQASTATGTDTQTTASTKTGDSVQSTMDETRTRLARPEITREGYREAQATELTADKLTGARVYGAKDEDVGEINRLVMNDNGQVKLVVLDIGGFLGMGEREIAVTPDELNIVRNDKGDDVRVYIDANKDALKAQPEYKSNE